MTETPNPNIIDADTLTGGIRPLRRVVLAIGSNVGDREANLQGGLNTLADTPELSVLAVSGLYEAVDAYSADRPLLCAVVLADSTLTARSLLERALAVEDAYGRVRAGSVPGAADSPRTLDVDLVAVGDRRVDEPDFKLPHPKVHERPFVLVPWVSLDPTAVLPGHGVIADLIKSLDTSGVTRYLDAEIYLE